MTVQRFQGTCDASAATRIAGTSCFVSASDEDYILRVYDSSRPGLPVSTMDVTSFLEPVNAAKEPDIEGSAQIGNRIYWIASHGRDKDAVEQESRQRLFATDVAVASGLPTFRTTGKPYKQLLADLSAAEDLAEFDLQRAATLPPEAPGGLNIEGMASTAEGHLLIGFRNPIPQGRALIVRLHNPEEVVAGRGRARVSLGALLDLGNRGIRALEPIAGGRYLVLAGSFDDTRNFSLFLWDGISSAPSQLVDGTSLNDLNPEELVMVPETTGGFLLFSDDGDLVIGPKKCKKVEPANRAFRATAVQLAV